MNDPKAIRKTADVTDDRAIRAALVRKRLRHHRERNDTLLIHELGLVHARSRIDLAVINGVVHGYEIKSEQDSLSRLPSQLEVYRQTLQKLTFVVAEKHLSSVLMRVPRWCGVLLARRGPRGALHIETVQKASRNPDLNLFLMAHLLWRDEAQEILAGWGADKAKLRSPRAVLYREVVCGVSESRLTALIKAAMMQRSAWRDHS
ncbi:MAG: sce7726 family protein [Rhodobacteraceae bacterium]|nr:sce7726 family protein [Paracoccaceae bacterium]